MAIKIPVYERQVVPSQRGATPRMDLMDVSSGMEAIGNGIAQIGDAIERKRLDDDAVAINKTQNEAEIQWAEWMNNAQDSWKRGDKELPQQFFDGFDKWKAGTAPNLQTKQGKQIFENRMQEFRQLMGKNAIGWQGATNEKLKLMDLGQSRESMKKLAAANPGMAEALSARFREDTNNMILSPVQRERQQLDAENETAFAAEVGLMDKGQDAWKPDNKRWSWDKLSFEQQEQLKATHKRAMIERDRKTKAAIDAQEQIDKQSAKDLVEGELDGIRLSPQQMAEKTRILQTYKDKPWSQALTSASQYAGEATMIAMSPIQEQVAFAVKAKADIATAKPEDFGVAADRAKFIEQKVKANAEELKKDAWSYYERRFNPIGEPLDFSQDISGQLLSRQENAFVIQAATGVNPGVLKPAEVPQFTQLLQQAKPDEALNWINQIAAGDKTTAAATFNQLGKAAPGYAVSGQMQMTGARLPDGRTVGSVMLTGYKALEQKQVKLAEPNKVNTAISDEIGDMFAAAPDEYERAKDSVTWLLAGKGVMAGKYDYEPTSNDIELAIQQVVNPVEYNGKKVSAPVGTDPDEFDDVIESRVTAAIAASQLTEENKKLLARNHKLIDADGDGIYDLAWQSGVRVLDASNRPVKVTYK